MALTRSEIEILIKARNEAQGAFDSLSKQVSGVTSASATATQGLEKVGKATKDAGAASQGSSVMFGMLAERLARGLVGAFGDTIQAANKLDSGLIGLSSVAKAFGNDADAAKNAAKTLAADGLMSVGDAATGLKNLLAAGFGLKEANDLMIAFKNSAAFGRQGSLEFGEAIRGATEGIKNGNSILVDNAGVTKNLSVMLTDAGYSAQDLSKASSDVNIRMAIYNGIIKETNPMLGDTARFLDTAAGKQAAFSAQVEIAQQKVGKALQPALAALLNTLAPLVKAIGDNANVLIPLAGIIATVVVPMAAMSAAAAFGIPSIAAMTASLTALWTAASMSPVFGQAAATVVAGSTAIRTSSLILDQYGNKMQTAGVSTETAATKISAFAKVGAGLGAIMIGWQIGKIIDEFTGLSGSIERATTRLFGWGDAAQIAGAKQDAIARAIKNGAAATISYADAVQYNITVETIRLAQWDKSAPAQLKRIEGELALGRITLESANAQRGAIEAEKAAALVQGSRLKLTDAIVNSERAYKEEIKATGYTVGELTKILKTNESGFDIWAKQAKLGDDTIKRLKDSVKLTDDQQKKYQKTLEDNAKATEKLRDELFALGVVSGDVGTKELKKLIEPLTLAGDVTTPAFQMALIRLLPELNELAKKSAASGVTVAGLSKAIERSTKAADDQGAEFLAWENSITTTGGSIENLIGSTQRFTVEQELAGAEATTTAEAFKYFGISTRAELQKTATEAEIHYRRIASVVGAAAPEAVEAYRKMIEAQKAATRQIPSVWTTEIFPKVKGVIGTLTDAINGSFAQMLLGAKGFRDGFVDIWKSIKAAVGNILNSILSTFLNSFLKGLLGAMTGQKGAFASAFAGLFGGGGTAGGGSLFSMGLKSLFPAAAGVGALAAGGTATAATAGLGIMPGLGFGAGSATGLGGAAGGAGAAGGVSMAAIGGGLAAAGAGFMLGKVFQNIFGGAGVKAGIGGAASGAATGALIGSIVPGLGTAVGALVGGIAGALGGLLGKTVGMKVNDLRDTFFAQFGAAGTGAGSGFGTVAAELAKLSVGTGGGYGGGKLFKDLISAKNMGDFEAAVKRVEAALKSAEYATIAVREAEESLSIERQKAIAGGQTEADVLKSQAAAYSALLVTIQKTGATAPDALKPWLQALVDMGELIDENGNKIVDLGAVKFQSMAAAGAAALANVDAAVARSASSWRTAYETRGGFTGKGGGDQDQGDGLPGAAGGVLARQPGLVVFGEGGETEVGGPAGFFRNIFESLGLGDKAGPAGQAKGDTINIGPFNITAMSSADLKGTIERDVIPPILDALRVNRRGSLTDIKAILGVS